MICCIIERRMPGLLAKAIFHEFLILFFNYFVDSKFGGTLRGLVCISIALVSWWSLHRPFSVIIVWLLIVLLSMGLLSNVFFHVFHHRFIIVLNDFMMLRHLQYSVIVRALISSGFLWRFNFAFWWHYSWRRKSSISNSLFFGCWCLIFKCRIFLWNDRIRPNFLPLIVHIIDRRHGEVRILLIFGKSNHIHTCLVWFRYSVIRHASFEELPLCSQPLFIFQKSRWVGFILLLFVRGLRDTNLFSELFTLISCSLFVFYLRKWFFLL